MELYDAIVKRERQCTPHVLERRTRANTELNCFGGLECWNRPGASMYNAHVPCATPQKWKSLSVALQAWLFALQTGKYYLRAHGSLT